LLAGRCWSGEEVNVADDEDESMAPASVVAVAASCGTRAAAASSALAAAAWDSCWPSLSMAFSWYGGAWDAAVAVAPLPSTRGLLTAPVHILYTGCTPQPAPHYTLAAVESAQADPLGMCRIDAGTLAHAPPRHAPHPTPLQPHHHHARRARARSVVTIRRRMSSPTTISVWSASGAARRTDGSCSALRGAGMIANALIVMGS